MDGQNRRNIKPGMTVDIVLKEDQPTGKFTRGVVAQLLTSKHIHPRGIKVRLASGQVGRVQKIVSVASAGSRQITQRHSVHKDQIPVTPLPQKKSPCACCGYLTIQVRNAYEVCHVCYWEDDPSQFANPENSGGSNHISLSAARKNFAAFGACEQKYIKAVRKPMPEELPF